MNIQIVAVFCLCDYMLKALHHSEDPQCQMIDSEVMTTAIIAALHFRGNFELTRYFLWEHTAYVEQKSLQSSLASHPRTVSYTIPSVGRKPGRNSMTVPCMYWTATRLLLVTDYRICRSRRYQGEVWRGRQASKRRFFYGLKIHIIVTETGQPVEFFLTCRVHLPRLRYKMAQ
jgi:hypothetical protein